MRGCAFEPLGLQPDGQGSVTLLLTALDMTHNRVAYGREGQREAGHGAILLLQYEPLGPLSLRQIDASIGEFRCR